MTHDHEAMPAEGSAYSVEAQPNCGRQASLGNPHHYPVEAICSHRGCGEVIRCERMLQARWAHTGRKPGEPGTVTP